MNINIPVFIFGNAAPVAYVTQKQHAAEVAGKALRPIPDMWRKAILRCDAKGNTWWVASYFEPSADQINDWHNRWHNRYPRDSHGAITGRAKRIQINIAH